MSEIKEMNGLMSNILAQLQICREFIDEQFEAYGYDSAFFDVDIILKVKVDKLGVEVCEKWNRLE